MSNDNSWMEQPIEGESPDWGCQDQEEQHFYHAIAEYADLIKAFGEEQVTQELNRQLRRTK